MTRSVNPRTSGPQCLVQECTTIATRRGLCEPHYKYWHKHRSLAGGVQPTDTSIRPWLPREDDALRQVYAQHPSPDRVPVADLAALLGRTALAVRVRACGLGITESGRSNAGDPVCDIPCPVCGAMFKPVTIRRGVRQGTCSPSCARKKVIADYGHPRGALGMKHTDAAKAKTAAASRRMWAEMSDDERERRADITRQSVRVRIERGVDAERTHTRAVGGRRPDIGNKYFRSRWEANYARWLNWRISHTDELVGWEYEPKTFTFPVKRGTMSYTPDFLVTFTDGRAEWHEVKGWLTPRGATALKRFAKYYPSEMLVLIDEPVYRAITRTAKALIPEWESK